MIGVIAKPTDADVVAEFFELFKTPWEFARDGRRYDVVVSTTEPSLETNAKLLILYGAAATTLDKECGISVLSRRTSQGVQHDGISVPIYGSLAELQVSSDAIPCFGTAGVRLPLKDGRRIVRLGYNLFDEVRFLLSSGQPVEHAVVPTLDLHIAILRNVIVGDGIPLVEILPTPAGFSFAVCLTHDIDFVGIRDHKFDHTMLGFLYRSTAGTLMALLRRKTSFSRALRVWRATLSLPLVYLGWCRDFWEPFRWYLAVEKNLPVTYFLIPFKQQPGENVYIAHSSRRASSYDLTDIPEDIRLLTQHGCEISVHGIDGWHSAEKGQRELMRLATVTGQHAVGVRTHWLLADKNSFRRQDQAGYAYDSSSGYNETIGYRSGTTQVFRPLNASTLLELPLHIQDGALFFAHRLNLSEAEAWNRCQTLIEHARNSGGVLTLLWHDRSHAAERLWGDFYIGLIAALKSAGAWFATAGSAVEWFRRRRAVRFERSSDSGTATHACMDGGTQIDPPVTIRLYRPNHRACAAGNRDVLVDFVDIAWDGATNIALAEDLAETVMP